VERSYLYIGPYGGGGSFKLPTPKGEGIGIINEVREIRGGMCPLNLYSTEAQRFVIEEFLRDMAGLSAVNLIWQNGS